MSLGHPGIQVKLKIVKGIQIELCPENLLRCGSIYFVAENILVTECCEMSEIGGE